jgi:catechol 2,3-dioxygenase-like lactoylglutathione lyase family enzyme
MLKDSNVCAVLAVKDMAEAKEFYENKLGLKEDKVDGGGVLYKSGDSVLYVYESQFAGTNKATAAAWSVDNLEGIVQELKSKNVKFEHYDFPGVKREGDIHVMGKIQSAWVKDPDGNILNFVTGM